MGFMGYNDEDFYDPLDSPYARWLDDNLFKPGHNPKDLRIMLASKGQSGSSPEDQVASSCSGYHGARPSPATSIATSSSYFGRNSIRDFTHNPGDNLVSC